MEIVKVILPPGLHRVFVGTESEGQVVTVVVAITDNGAKIVALIFTIAVAFRLLHSTTYTRHNRMAATRQQLLPTHSLGRLKWFHLQHG